MADIVTIGAKTCPDASQICWGPKPPDWEKMETTEPMDIWFHRKSGLIVVTALIQTRDGDKWIHLSISRKDHPVEFDEMEYVKLHWLGPEALAVEVYLPDEEQPGSVTKYPSRNLWCCLAKRPLPDFNDVQIISARV